MRFVTAIATAFLVTALASGWSSGDSAPVTVTVMSRSEGVFRAIDGARANGREAPLASVAVLIPDPLPPAIAKQGKCVQGTRVEIRLSDGTTARYGPCRLPDTIRWLGSSVLNEADQWSGSVTGRTRIVGANAAERLAIRRILAAMKPTRIDTVRIVPLRSLAGWRRWKLPGDAHALDIANGGSLRAEWEATLVAGRYALLSGTAGLRSIAVVHLSRSSDRAADTGEPATAHASLVRVRKRAAAAGADVVELRRVGDGIALTLRTSDPAAFLKHDGALVLAALAGPKSSGYFGVEDGSGTVVYASGWTPSSGMFYSRIDLYECGPIHHFGGPVLTNRSRPLEPPCAA